MAKLYFIKFSREVKEDVIQLCGRRISPLSSNLQETGEVIKQLIIKGNEFPDSPLRVDRFPGEPLGDLEMLPFARTSHFRLPPTFGSLEWGTLVICHLPLLEMAEISVNCLLDTRERSSLAELRHSGYRVPQGRQAVKTALASCALCRKFNARPVIYPNVASRPIPRVE